MANDESIGAEKPKTTRKAPAKKTASAAPKSSSTGGTKKTTTTKTSAKKTTTTRKPASRKPASKADVPEVAASGSMSTEGIGPKEASSPALETGTSQMANQETREAVSQDASHEKALKEQPASQSTLQTSSEDKGGKSMSNESNSDKGFWVQMILGIVVMVLIFMYIRSLSGKPATQAASSPAQSAQVASAEPKKDPGVALAEAAARMSSADAAEATQPDADVAEPAPVVEQSVVAVIEEIPAVPAQEQAPAQTPEPAPVQAATAEPAPAEAQPVAAAAPVAEPEVAAAPAPAPVEAPPVAPAEKAEPAVAKEEAAKPSTTAAEDEPAQAVAEAKPEATSETKTEAKAEAGSGENKGRDWLSKLGFGESDQAAEETKQAKAANDKAAEAKETAAAAPAAETKTDAAQEPAVADTKAAEAAAPALAEQQPAQPQPGRFDPYVVAPPMDAMPAPGATADVPDWAKERMERVEKLRSELQESMTKMHEQAVTRAKEERQRRYEERLQAMPDWMRAHVEKIDQLRKDLREESMALQKAMREHRVDEAMAQDPAASEEAADGDDEQGPDMSPAAPYYPPVMPYGYGPRGYAYPSYPYRY